MVEATVTNDPVSIQLQGSSTTVPSNETWVVTLTVHSGESISRLKINNKATTKTSDSQSDPHPPGFRMTLTGGDTITEIQGDVGSMVSIQGFVVDS